MTTVMEEIAANRAVSVKMEFLVRRKQDGVPRGVLLAMKETTVTKVNTFFCGLDNVYNNQPKFLESNH